MLILHKGKQAVQQAEPPAEQDLPGRHCPLDLQHERQRAQVRGGGGGVELLNGLLLGGGAAQQRRQELHSRKGKGLLPHREVPFAVVSADPESEFVEHPKLGAVHDLQVRRRSAGAWWLHDYPTRHGGRGSAGDLAVAWSSGTARRISDRGKGGGCLQLLQRALQHHLPTPLLLRPLQEIECVLPVTSSSHSFKLASF